MKYYIQTLGCAMNYSDSERVASVLEDIGYERTAVPEETDLYIFNTCSIRQKGEDRVYGQLRNVANWKKHNPRLMIGITGCMVRDTSSRNTEENKDDLLRRLEELDFVFRINDTHRLPQIMEEAEPQLELPTVPSITETGAATDYLKVAPKYTSDFQAFVPIQIGCDNYCTYCIVPYSRGREKSRPFDEIVAECRALVEGGCKEITLVGQTVNSYGKSVTDQKAPDNEFAQMDDPFVELLTQLDKLQELGLSRLRFTSPHPRDYSDALIEAHATLNTLTPHFHLPIQAGDDEVLQRMNRQYTLEHYAGLVDKIRKRVPDASITTDIIVGFCGETDEQFARTEQAFKDLQWDMAYLARYSPRTGTTSVRAWQDDVSRQEKARRWHALNDILEKSSAAYHANMIGQTHEVLIEKYLPETAEYQGRARNNKVVQFPADPQAVKIATAAAEKEAEALRAQAQKADAKTAEQQSATKTSTALKVKGLPTETAIIEPVVKDPENLIGELIHIKITSSQKWTVKGERTDSY